MEVLGLRRNVALKGFGALDRPRWRAQSGQIRLAMMIFAVLPQAGQTAGIALMEQSVKELGQAFAGATTNVEDGSSVYFNPATMARTTRPLVSAAGYAILSASDFSGQGSRLDPRLGGAPLLGGEGGDDLSTSLVPNLYAIAPVSERFVLGFGVNVPFASQRAYAPDWQGRYQSLSSRLTAVNFNPSLAFRVTEQLSLGVGLNIQYLRSSLANAIDFGSVCLAALPSALCAGQGLLPQQADGRVTIKGDSVGFGYDLGLHYSPHPNTDLGVAYRSRISHQIEGTAKFVLPAAALPLTSQGSFTDTDMVMETTAPDSVAFGFTQRLSSQWTVSGDALWTQWSLNRELAPRFATGQSPTPQALEWRDTWRYALGLSYSPEPAWTVRTGLAYDQTPVSGAARRSPRLPDSDRVWLSVGLSYRAFEHATVHAAYAHLFFRDASSASVGATGDRLMGEYQQQADILGLQLDWRF